MDETDERITAWHEIAAHPFFADAFNDGSSLLDAMKVRLDRLMATPAREATQAEEPVEWRLLRAFTNGYAEGLRRGVEGRLDR